MERIINILKGVLGAFLFTFVFIIIFSFILANTDISDNTIKPALIGMTVLSLSFNSFKTLKKIKSKGIVYGALIGMIYLLIIFIISLPVAALIIKITKWCRGNKLCAFLPGVENMICSKSVNYSFNLYHIKIFIT